MKRWNGLLTALLILAVTILVSSMATAAQAPRYFSHPNYANSPLPTIVTPGTCSVTVATACSYDTDCPTGESCNGVVVSGGIRKFVDGLPGLSEGGVNNLGQYIPVAVPDTTTYPGSDYYEIAVVQYREQMHSDLPGTLLRGYVQLSTSVVPGAQVPLSNAQLDGSSTPIANYTGVTAPHYLGPAIVATKNRPVRILFRNLLPTGVAGNLFIPTDTTVMGSGMGPMMDGMMEPDPQNPMCGEVPKPEGCYTENRATLHLHGGISPWISDGTPHQWTTPASENTPYPKGVSVQNVPDMPDPGPGAITFFYTNQQSARLMFYHDHAWGITRLNVYAGEAAPYIITDDTEKKLLPATADNPNGLGLIPGSAETIPLVIQDKTFVPSPAQLAVSDETWDATRWGGFGNLWLPHVYSPAQNPGDISGVNQYGRWAYGPWFWPPTRNIAYGPIANPYFDPNCNPDAEWCEPPTMPGTPFNSMGMEAFNDTPVVNGTAYPTVTVDPKTYRLRILNAASDRFFNLSIFQADASGKEVALNAAEVAAALSDPAGVFPTPDTAISPAGPNWIQIGTEGGFLPAPVVIPPQHITWVTDPTVFNAGNVDQHSLLLGPAERADVIVDFSQYAGKTLILYNDAPAAFPARDPRYDYYTGNADLRDTGGAPPTLPGYGPNTRTVMQIKVNAGPAAPAFNLAALQTAFAHKPDGTGVFESGQHPIIVGQGAYNSAYGTTFQNNGPNSGTAQIFDFSLSFKTLANGAAGTSMTIPFQTKAIQDEMGEAFDHDYGRMSGNLGLEVPLTAAGTQQNLILYPYVNPASEVLKGVELPPGVDVTPISSADDGTQIWKITHNGVDTHPIHFHLFDVQVLNRVGWDGIIRKPDLNELGWKDTLRISPLEDTIVALRPIIPKIPFGLPDSVRPLNPMMPLGSTAMFTNVDAFANPITPPITNVLTNFGWEYVWHCHILSHEEMDMMRPISVSVSRTLPAAPVLSATGNSGRPVTLTWTDGTPVTTNLATWGNPANEIGFQIERASGNGDFTFLANALANTTSYTDTTTSAGNTYQYRVRAYNAAGNSPFSNNATPVAPAPATGVTLTANPASPKAAGTSITFTAAGSGGSGTYEYQFWLRNLAGTWSVVRNYSTTASWVWNTSGLQPGTYNISVYVRSLGSSASYETIKSLSYVITPTPATGATLTANPASPQTAGPSVTFTAAGSGGSGTYEYQFWFRNLAGTWSMVRNYSTTASWVWDTSGLQPGTYNISVYVRSLGSSASYETIKSLSYVIAPTPATGATLTANPASPQTAGPSVTFTAAGSGGSGTYEYQFWFRNLAGTWSVVRNYSTTASWVWNTSGLQPGTYNISVYVRSLGSSASYETIKSLSYVIAPTPATGATLTPDQASPQQVGTAATFTAAGSGGSGIYEYQFWLRNLAGTWSVIRNYSTTASWVWNTSGLQPGTYNVSVYVRSLGSSASYEAIKSMSYQLSP